MLNHNPLACQTPIALFFSFCQRMVFGFFERRLTVFMKLHQSLVTSIGQKPQMCRELTGIVFEQLEVVFASMTKSGGYDLGTFSIRHHLRFLGVTLLFAAIMPFLAFFGRSTGCSLTSTSTISNTVSLPWSAFLPGKQVFLKLLTLRMVRHTVKATGFQRIGQYEIPCDILAQYIKVSNN
ncbi:MAG: hypothetical protein U0X93_10985 [Anaerolineales bacterium]